MRFTSVILVLLVIGFQNLYGQCIPGTLYGVNGGSNEVNSRLFTLNASTGIFQIVGDIGYTGVKGIAIHPQTCVMYGVAKPNGSGGDEGQLLRINLNTGVGTPIGDPIDTRITDLTFSPEGVLYGFDRVQERLLIIDICDASSTPLADLSAVDWDRIGISFDRDGSLFLKDGSDDLYEANPNTGALTGFSVPFDTDFELNNSLAVDNQNIMYTINFEDIEDDMDEIWRINQNTGEVALVGTTNVTDFFEDNFTAIEFCPEKAIPTLSQWGLAILMLVFLIFGMVAVNSMTAKVSSDFK